MKELVCIVCPRGCRLSVDENLNVTGNACNRGPKYAIDELTNPKRMLTSTVKVIDGEINLVPVVTKNPIPKDKIFEVMNEINKIKIKAPVLVGDVIISNVLNLGVDIVATRDVKESK